MSSGTLHNALMRPAILQILRAAGFHKCSHAVLDVVTDLAIRYIQLIGTSAAKHALSNHNELIPTVQDVRMALHEAGMLRPQMGITEERAKGMVEVNGQLVPFEDMRGVEGFLKWARGPANREIRRIAGLVSATGDVTAVAVLEGHEDYISLMKKKHSLSGEDSRYDGTILGKEPEEQQVILVGGPPSIEAWNKMQVAAATSAAISTLGSSSFSSSPLTPMDDTFGDDES